MCYEEQMHAFSKQRVLHVRVMKSRCTLFLNSRTHVLSGKQDTSGYLTCNVTQTLATSVSRPPKTTRCVFFLVRGPSMQDASSCVACKCLPILRHIPPQENTAYLSSCVSLFPTVPGTYRPRFIAFIAMIDLGHGTPIDFGGQPVPVPCVLPV